MATEYLDALREKYGFSSWRGINPSGREFELRGVSLTQGVVGGLDARQVREIDPGDGSRLLRAAWKAPDKDESLLLMDVRECSSRLAAHEVLLEALANFQAPEVRRLEGDAPGDIAFAVDASAAVVFARGNIVVSIANGGTELVGADSIARRVDDWLLGQVGASASSS